MKATPPIVVELAFARPPLNDLIFRVHFGRFIGIGHVFPVYSHYMTQDIADPYSELCSVYILKITCESGVIPATAS